MNGFSIGLQVVVLAFAAGGAWFGVKAGIKAAHARAAAVEGKVDQLAGELRAGLAAVHARLDSIGARARADVVRLEDVAKHL